MLFLLLKGGKEMLQKRVFGLLMAIFMVLGMEVYNAFLQHGFYWQTLLHLPWLKAILVIVIVMLVQTYLGGPIAQWLTNKIAAGRNLSSKKIIVLRQIFTVCFMCPTMSFMAIFLFKGGMQPQFLQIWIKAIAYNFPMAFCWSVFVVGPLVRYMVGSFFQKKSISVMQQVKH